MLLLNQSQRSVQFLQKEPLRNHTKHPARFDVENAPARSLSYNQVRIPTFMTHFFVSPMKPCCVIRSSDWPLETSHLWCTTTPEQATRVEHFLYHTLQQAGIVMDSTLTSNIGKAVNRAHEWMTNRFKGRELPPPSNSIMHDQSPVRIRHGYIMNGYQMLTNVGHHVAGPVSPEWSPRWIALPCWKWLSSRASKTKTNVLPLHMAQNRLVFLPPVTDDYRQLRIACQAGETQWISAWLLKSPDEVAQAGSYEYHCITNIAQLWLGTLSFDEINWSMILRGLVSLMRSETAAMDQLRALFTMKQWKVKAGEGKKVEHTRPDLDEVLTRLQNDQHLAEQQVEQIVHNLFDSTHTAAHHVMQNSLQRYRSGSDMSECCPTRQEWSVLFSPQMYAHHLRQIADSPLRCNEMDIDFLIDQICLALSVNDPLATQHMQEQANVLVYSSSNKWLVSDLSTWLLLRMIQISGALAAFFQFRCPRQVIPAQIDGPKQILCDSDLPRIYRLLNKFFGEVRRPVQSSHLLQSKVNKSSQLTRTKSSIFACLNQ